MRHPFLVLISIALLSCSKTATENKLNICDGLSSYNYQLDRHVISIRAPHREIWNGFSSAEQKENMRHIKSCLGTSEFPIQILSLSLTQRDLENGKSAREYIQSGAIKISRGIVDFKISTGSTVENSCKNAPEYQRTCRRGIYLDDLGINLTVHYFFNPEWKEGYFVSPDEWPWEVYPRETPVEILEQAEMYVRSLIVSTNLINP